MLCASLHAATWIASLSLTSVSINTAIYNVNPLLVYVFSIPLLHEPVSLTKAVAVLGALAATSIVARGTNYESASEGDRAQLGALIVFASAAIYSLKEVLFKRAFASVSVSLTPFTDSLLVVAIIGLASVVSLVPISMLLHYTGIETFAIPPPELAKAYAMVAILMGVYQACSLAAIALTSPTFVAMGSMFTVPASMLYDYAVRGYVVPPLSRVGILGIVLAFALLTMASQTDSLGGALCRSTLRRCALKSNAISRQSKDSGKTDLV